MERDAGITSREKNCPKEHDLSVHKDNGRSYNRKDETDRDIKRNEVLIKDYQFYNRKDSLWNDTAKLQPIIAKYNVDNIDPTTTFKKTIRNLSQITAKEKEQKCRNDFNMLVKIRKEDAERYAARKLERFITQY